MVSDKRGTNPVAMTIIKREKEREKERDRERKRERQIGIFFLNNKNYIIVPLNKRGRVDNSVKMWQCLLFPQCFLFYQRQKLSFSLHLICCLQILSIRFGPKLSCGNGMFSAGQETVLSQDST